MQKQKINLAEHKKIAKKIQFKFKVFQWFPNIWSFAGICSVFCFAEAQEHFDDHLRDQLALPISNTRNTSI